MKQKLMTCLRGLYRRKAAIGICAAALVVAFSGRAVAQFGVDPCCAIISAGLSTISNLLKSVVAQPLGSIQQIQQQSLNYQQQVVFPLGAINQVRSFAGQLQGQFTQMRQISQMPVFSATLAGPQQLEQSILSRSTGTIPQIGANYTSVYGPVMSQTDASPQIRNVTDTTDAEAQAALKKAVEIDNLADLELQAAEQMNQQLQDAAPGTAPMLEAEVGAWLVRANAYTQSATAELLRVRSIELAGNSAKLKFSTSHQVNLRNTTNQLLGTPR